MDPYTFHYDSPKDWAEIHRRKSEPLNPPMAPFNRTNSFYGGARTVTEQFTWDREIPSYITSIPGFSGTGVVHLKDTFVISEFGRPSVIDDVHHYYFACGKTLEKLLVDFKNDVERCWRMARLIVPEFPHHSISLSDKVLDPTVDDQPKYFNEYRYVRIDKTSTKSLPISATFRSETPKGTSTVHCEMYYDKLGRFGGLSCCITRGSKEWDLEVDNYDGRLYVAQIEMSTEMLRYLNSRVVYSGDYDDYVQALKSRGIDITDVPRLTSRNPGRTKPRAVKSIYTDAYKAAAKHISVSVSETSPKNRPQVDQRFSVKTTKLSDEELASIAVGQRVNHDDFGQGSIASKDDKYIVVQFDDKERKFAWPSAFEKGFLSFV